jgi:hypothetical protein
MAAMLESADIARLSWAVDLIRNMTIHDALKMVLPAPKGSNAREVLATTCAIDHVGLAAFPDRLTDLTAYLTQSGISVYEVVPSVVVKERLACRYGLAPKSLDVHVVRGLGAETSTGCRQLEVFAILPSPDGALPIEMPIRERETHNESPVAFIPMNPGEKAMENARRALISSGLMQPDGAGHNPHHYTSAGGVSVIYFRAATVPSKGAGIHRIEITCPGHCRSVIDSHCWEEAEARL